MAAEHYTHNAEAGCGWMILIGLGVLALVAGGVAWLVLG